MNKTLKAMLEDVSALMENEQLDRATKLKTLGERLADFAHDEREDARDQWNKENPKLIPWKTEAQALGLIASIRNEHGVEALAAWCKKLLPKSESEDDAHSDGYEQGITDVVTVVDDIRAEANSPAVADVLNVIVRLLEAMKP